MTYKGLCISLLTKLFRFAFKMKDQVATNNYFFLFEAFLTLGCENYIF